VIYDTAYQVENKLKKMIRDYKKATDWRNATGRGVEEAGVVLPTVQVMGY
jgi:hypothetical protein